MNESELLEKVLKVHTDSILRELDIFRQDVNAKFAALNKTGCTVGQDNKSRLDKIDGRALATGAYAGGFISIIMIIVQALLSAAGITMPKGTP